ncbi:PAS domain-containing protein [Paraferrimonas haliotis]|uniref:Diguanylate cyclase n=1 Tax=Paraferrimonas haliotis TaxID=2013866 RepID=A0AA37WXX4_9GAMM|nr:PAS domain-containing protein [Paraferrimonas haliotis]GLS83075.1 diguanylate cyclase [Paraferrimonas haliotis]
MFTSRGINTKDFNSLHTVLQPLYWGKARIALIVVLTLSVICGVFFGAHRISESHKQHYVQQWAQQAYNKLQSIAVLTTAEMKRQVVRTELFAKAKDFEVYLASPEKKNASLLRGKWRGYTRKLDSMLGLAFYDAEGKVLLRSNSKAMPEYMPDLAEKGYDLEDPTTYFASDFKIRLVDGKFIPTFYLINAIESRPGKIAGYFAHYVSAERIFNLTAPTLSLSQTPVIALDSMGTMFFHRGLNQSSQLVSTIGDNLAVSSPYLWHEVKEQGFGQFKDENATYVFIRADLSNSSEAFKQNYYLVTELTKNDVDRLLALHTRIIFGIAAFICLLLLALVISTVLLRNERSNRGYSHNLANGLFGNSLPCLIVSSNYRVLFANDAAREFFTYSQQLEDASLTSILEQTEQATKQMLADASSTGSIQSITFKGKPIRIELRPIAAFVVGGESVNQFLLTLFDDSTLHALRDEITLQRKQLDVASISILSDAHGVILKANAAYYQFLQQYHLELAGENLEQLLNEQSEQAWQRILHQCKHHQLSNTQIDFVSDTQDPVTLHISGRGHFSEDGQLATIAFIARIDKPIVEAASLDLQSTSQQQLTAYFDGLSKPQRALLNVMLFDVSPINAFALGQDQELEQELQEQLRLQLPSAWKIMPWFNGQTLVVTADSEAQQLYHKATQVMQSITRYDREERISVAISGNPKAAELTQLLSQLEVALGRAKQMSGMKICLAFSK